MLHHLVYNVDVSLSNMSQWYKTKLRGGNQAWSKVDAVDNVFGLT